MIMSRADQQVFPKLARYVRRELPTVANIDSVARAFRRYAQMNRTTLRGAPAWGNQPTLKFANLVNATGGFLFGEFTPDSNSDEIRAMRFAFPIEGLEGQAMLNRDQSGWRVTEVRLTEH